MNIFLIGYRCTGKTTVGKALAERLEHRFVDTDRMVVERSGMSIARMVAKHGWKHFRGQEHDALKAACANKKQVVGTGGGVVLDTRNCLAMQRTGKVVWLTADEKTIQSRMRVDETTAGSRPSLTGRGLLEEIETVMAERSPLYEKAADLIVETDRKTVEEICDRITKELRIGESVN
jgi:shikimate kinase